MTPSSETTPVQLDRILDAAEAASHEWAATAPLRRAEVIESLAFALDAHATDLIRLAETETHLPLGRLRGELTRTTFQLRLFGEVLRDGGYLDVRIDHPDREWPMGAPRPDLRRMLVPLGPVVVFAASNFPFAFSVAGGDTASALAAGCPVILKAHSGHPELSRATAEVMVDSLRATGAPEGLFALIQGRSAGTAALVDPRVRAGAFTGSIPGGRALFDLAVARPDPIPFYAEMGSVNPVFVTASAAAERAEAIAAGFVGSFTLGAGQFCTKPGVLLAPADSPIPAVLRSRELPGGAAMLNERIRSAYLASLDALATDPRIEVVTMTGESRAPAPVPVLLATTAEHLIEATEELFVECFGPVAVLATYTDESQMVRLADRMGGQLTASVHGRVDDAVLADLLPVLVRRAGRLLWNQWPTGVSVTYAQQHGGPYPATTAPGTTSVGTAAIGRFVRPVAWQGFPEELLPAELREADPEAVPRTVDGRREGPTA